MVYKNSFYNAKYQDSKPVIETAAIPVEYKGFLIYQRSKYVFDIVKNDVCVGTYAGIKGAKNRIDKIS